jgi:hypothetical protein
MFQCEMASSNYWNIVAQRPPIEWRSGSGQVNLSDPISHMTRGQRSRSNFTFDLTWPDVKGHVKGQMSRSKVKVTFVDILTDGCVYLRISSRGGLRVSGASLYFSHTQWFHHDWNLDLEYIISAITIKAMTRLLYVALKMMTFNFLCFAWCCSQN